MRVKKIIISVADGFHWKYLYNTKIIPNLNALGYEIVLLLPVNMASEAHRKTNRLQSIKIIAISNFKYGKLALFLLALFPLLNRRYTETENYQKEEFDKRYSFKLRYFIAKISNIKKINSIVLKILTELYRKRDLREIIEKENADLIICSTPGQKLLDIPVLIASKDLRIPSFCPVYSWDNLTSKGNIVFKPTYLAVWNDIMVKEAVTLHSYDADNVFKLGSPTFEGYFEADDLIEKSKFIAQIFVSEQIDRYLLVTTVPARFYGDAHIDLVYDIIERLEQLNYSNFGVLLRVHPMDHTDYSVFENNKRIYIDYFGSEKAESREKALERWFPADENIKHLKNSIMHSELCINVASTISLEAALCGKRVLNIAYFSKKENYNIHGDPKRFYKYTHYRPIIDNKITKLILNKCQLHAELTLINEEDQTLSKNTKTAAMKFLGADTKNSVKLIVDKIAEILT